MAVVRVTAIVRPYRIRWKKEPPGQRGALFKEGRQAWWADVGGFSSRYQDRRMQPSSKKQFRRERVEAFRCRICHYLHMPSHEICLTENGAPMACSRCYYNKVWQKAARAYPRMCYGRKKLSNSTKEKLVTLGVALYVLREIAKINKRNKAFAA